MFKLSTEDKRAGRQAFDELLNAKDHEEDKYAFVAVMTVTSLLLHRKKAREEAKLAKHERPHVN